MKNEGIPGLKVSISATPRYAPANYESLEAPEITITDDWDESRSHGRGVPSYLKCEACGYGGATLADNEKNLRIFFYSSMQRNGNYSTRSEIVCSKCNMFSTIESWEEG